MKSPLPKPSIGGPGQTEPGEPPSITTPGDPPPLSGLAASAPSRTPLALSRPSTQLPGGVPSVAWGSAPPGPPSSVGEAPPPSDFDDDKPTLIGDLIADRYRIQSELGSGGMGTVFRAEHVHMRKIVALKILHRELTYLPEVVARFEREAVAAARIEHPNVATAKDFGRLENGSFYLVLEYIEGKSLREVLESGALRPDVALHVARQIASALEAAHGNGIVHRDLKPDNVMLIQKGNEPYLVKVLDFGIAKMEIADTHGGLTQAGTVFGTPEYMAPEQAAGTPVDVRADLYTLGIMLYEMLSGATPFADNDMVVVLTRQMTLDPPPLPQSVDPALVSLVMQLLAKDPDARPQTAAEVCSRIDGLMGLVSSPYSTAEPWTPSPVSQLATEAKSVQYSDTVLSVAGTDLQRLVNARTEPKIRTSIFEQITTHITQRIPILKKNIGIAGHTVPVWALVALGALVLVLTGIIFGIVVMKAVGGPSPSTSSSGAAPTKSKSGVDLKSVEEGDPKAVESLEASPETGRNAAEWRALGRGQLKNRKSKDALAAYAKALELDSSLQKDKQLAVDVREIALDSRYTQSALELAVASLGSNGADVAYDVWSSTRSNKEQADVNKIAKTIVDGSAIRKNASPALLVALDLAKSKSCGDYGKALSKARENADARSLTKLKSLSARRGCGFLRLSDCWSCLRGNDDLATATKQAESHPAPTFP